jgi:hypothetical protein
MHPNTQCLAQKQTSKRSLTVIEYNSVFHRYRMATTPHSSKTRQHLQHTPTTEYDTTRLAQPLAKNGHDRPISTKSNNDSETDQNNIPLLMRLEIGEQTTDPAKLEQAID